MPRFKSIIFYQNSPKIVIFEKKAKISRASSSVHRTLCLRRLGALHPEPQIVSRGLGIRTQSLKHSPPLRISEYTPGNFVLFIITCVFCSFCFKQFFLDRSVANLTILTVDVCLMFNCFLFEKFYLHYAPCDFDSILCHCT